jgi:hypothetical protein
MAIYGDILSFFPELKKKYVYFRARPLTTGGYGTRTDVGTIVGILQYVKSGDILKQNDTEADVEVPAFWTRTKMHMDSYLEDEDGVVYKRTKPNDWKSYGNFYVYVLETVVNILDTQTSNPSVSVVNGRYA